MCGRSYDVQTEDGEAPPPPSRCRKCCRCIYTVLKYSPNRLMLYTKDFSGTTFLLLLSRFMRYIFPLTLFMGISFGGAYLFEWLEGQNERDAITRQRQERQNLLDALWNQSQSGDMGRADWEQYASKLLRDYEELRVTELQPVFPIDGDVEDQLWTLWGALLYCGTIYTTIGYGLIAPKTTAGRACTIAYAMIGIPVCMVVLGNLGKLMALALRKLHWLLWRIFKYAGKAGHMAGNMAEQVAESAAGQMASLLQKSRSKDSNINSEGEGSGKNGSNDTKSIASTPSDTPILPKETAVEMTSPVTNATVIPDEPAVEDIESEEDFSPSAIFPIIVLVLYIFGGAWMYTRWETSWNYFESAYFIFVSLSTIGLGDVTPTHRKFFILSSIYILFGLTLVSFVINTLLLQAQKTLKQAHKAPKKFMKMGKSFTGSTVDKLKEIGQKKKGSSSSDLDSIGSQAAQPTPV